MPFSNFYGATDEAQSHTILSTDLDDGVTHIDTATAYGPCTSESLIAVYLARPLKERAVQYRDQGDHHQRSGNGRQNFQ